MNEIQELIQLVDEAGMLHLRLLGYHGPADSKFWRVVRRANLRHQRRLERLAQPLSA